MKRLWETKRTLNEAVEAFTVGDDPALDARLLPYEVYGSVAHAAGLKKIGVLTAAQFKSLKGALAALLKSKKFKINREQEDIHTAVEQHLTKKLGPTGARIHAGRSRNDQVQTDLRLYLKDALLELHALSLSAAENWLVFSRENQTSLLPGYTHLQRAMPTTLGHWSASHVEALLEGAQTLKRAYDEADASPLGSAAGFGVSLKLPRAYTAKILGFSRIQRNTLRVQTSRPRLEAAVVSALALVARDLGVLAADLSLFTTREFGFLSLSSDFTTGSSIMPQKRNPDVVELLRAKAALFPGWTVQILSIGALPSGYHRDYQATKKPLMESLDTLRDMLKIVEALAGALTVKSEACRASVTEELLATHKALEFVKEGLPFREAYRKTAEEARLKKDSAPMASKVPLPSYEGAPGNPGAASYLRELKSLRGWNRAEAKRLHAAWDALIRRWREE